MPIVSSRFTLAPAAVLDTSLFTDPTPCAEACTPDCVHRAAHMLPQKQVLESLQRPYEYPSCADGPAAAEGRSKSGYIDDSLIVLIAGLVGFFRLSDTFGAL